MRERSSVTAGHSVEYGGSVLSRTRRSGRSLGEATSFGCHDLRGAALQLCGKLLCSAVDGLRQEWLDRQYFLLWGGVIFPRSGLWGGEGGDRQDDAGHGHRSCAAWRCSGFEDRKSTRLNSSH